MNAENASVFMFHSLYHPIFGCLCDGKTCSNPATALMVGAVDQAGVQILIEMGEEGARCIAYRMDLILAVKAVLICSLQVLDQSSAKIDIDDLHSSADAKNRFPGEDKGMEKRKLDTVQFPVRGIGALVFLSEPDRMDVTTAGKQQFIKGSSV